MASFLEDLHLDPSLADPEHCLKEQFHLCRNGGCGEVPGRSAPGSLFPDRSHHRLEVQGGPAVRILQRGVHRYRTLSLADPDPQSFWSASGIRIRIHEGQNDPPKVKTIQVLKC